MTNTGQARKRRAGRNEQLSNVKTGVCPGGIHPKFLAQFGHLVLDIDLILEFWNLTLNTIATDLELESE
jgi:hypothetical protein